MPWDSHRWRLGSLNGCRPSRGLEEALRLHIPNLPGIRDAKATWDELSEEIDQMETGFRDGQHGKWHALWRTIGRGKDVVDPWIALIPDEYGLV